MTTSRDKLTEIQAQLTAGVEHLTASDEWQRMLQVAARFHGYSWANTILIYLQRPDATRVAGYRQWQQLGRQVRKGERGIRILAPRFRWVEEENDAGETTKARVLVGFIAVSVFDVAQTDGQPLPDVAPAILDGPAESTLWDRLAALVAGHGYTLRRETPDGSTRANGRTEPMTRTVWVRPDRPFAQQVKTLAHELAHIRLGHVDDIAAVTTCRGRVEVEAEAVAYVVLTALGVDTSGYSLPYVAGWAGGDVETVRQTAERVIETAHSVLTDLSASATPVAEAA